MVYWFSADSHFYHGNIIKHCNRPFTSVTEMNSELIKRWNEKVKKDDIIYHLGDLVCFCSKFKAKETIDKLNGRIHLIKGNHDKPLINDLCLPRFESVKDLDTITIQENGKTHTLVLCHYAMRVWNKKHWGVYHLFGHSHGALPEDNSLSMDVGVDTNNFYPYSLEEVTNKLSGKQLGAKNPIAF